MSDEIIKEHSTKLAKIETILDRVAGNQDKMVISVQQMAIHMGKIEFLIEKFTNLEVNTKNSIDRIHKRVDSLEAEIDGKAEAGHCDDIRVKLSFLEPLVFACKYPKITIAIVAMVYASTISDIRHGVIKALSSPSPTEYRKDK